MFATGPLELAVLRNRAIQLREGTLRSRGDALLPLMLASYIFESLVITQTGGNRRPGDEMVSRTCRNGSFCIMSRKTVWCCLFFRSPVTFQQFVMSESFLKD